MRTKTFFLLLLLPLTMLGCSSASEEATSPSTSNVASEAVSDDSDDSTSSTKASTPEDYDSAMKTAERCMKERGWNVKHDPRDQSFAAEYAVDQADLYRADYSECVEGKVPEAKAVEDMSDEEIGASYYAQIEHSKCIEGKGYPVEEPPSLEAYTDQLRAGTVTWVAGLTDVNLSESEYYALLEACPKNF